MSCIYINIYIYTWYLCFKIKMCCPLSNTRWLSTRHYMIRQTAFECVPIECQSLSIAQWKLIFFLLKNMLSLTLSFNCIDYRRIIEIFRIFLYHELVNIWCELSETVEILYNIMYKQNSTHFVTILIRLHIRRNIINFFSWQRIHM